MEKLTRIQVIKRFFEADGGKKLGMQELKALSNEDKDELATLAAKELGVEVIQK